MAIPAMALGARVEEVPDEETEVGFELEEVVGVATETVTADGMYCVGTTVADAPEGAMEAAPFGVMFR